MNRKKNEMNWHRIWITDWSRWNEYTSASLHRWNRLHSENLWFQSEKPSVWMCVCVLHTETNKIIRQKWWLGIKSRESTIGLFLACFFLLALSLLLLHLCWNIELFSAWLKLFLYVFLLFSLFTRHASSFFNSCFYTCMWVCVCVCEEKSSGLFGLSTFPHSHNSSCVCIAQH